MRCSASVRRNGVETLTVPPSSRSFRKNLGLISQPKFVNKDDSSDWEKHFSTISQLKTRQLFSS
ncbi:hypothetical protein SAMN05444169_7612 [Bradyrhizobium erythrophlei]|uniref:Uncharacterized protein n=1 Tax=Bradyrhizobium erythrophlei TaxID=1437360 RepID=A0A1M5T8B4_9BRAD|nr:hypothetical protein SAMN05444169_7612 [Bradyrhizobium erythrophlei]